MCAHMWKLKPFRLFCRCRFCSLPDPFPPSHIRPTLLVDFFQIIKKQFYIQHFTHFYTTSHAMGKACSASKTWSKEEMSRDVDSPLKRFRHRSSGGKRMEKSCTRLDWIRNWFVLHLRNVHMKNYSEEKFSQRKKGNVHAWVESIENWKHAKMEEKETIWMRAKGNSRRFFLALQIGEKSLLESGDVKSIASYGQWLFLERWVLCSIDSPDGMELTFLNDL